MDAPPDLDAQLRRLMSRAQQGDTKAYTALLRTIAPRIRQAIRRRRTSRDDGAIEDVVQEVLLAIHTVRATYDPSRPFLPWLNAIVRYKVADAARRYSRLQSREVVVDDIDVTFEAEPANTPVEETGDRAALQDAIRALPAGQRQAVELLKLQELSLKEASAQTGLSIGALKLATHRAMASLRRAMRGSERDEH